MIADDQRDVWLSDLDAALAQYQRAIDLLYGLLVLDPGVSIEFDGNVAEIERLIGLTLSAKQEVGAPLPPPPPTPGPDDHGDSISEATFLDIPSVTPGAINHGTDRDYFAFDAQVGTSYVIETLLGTLDDPTLALYDTNGIEIDFNDDFFDLESRLDYTAPSSETLYIAVAGFDDAQTGSYELRITTVDLGPDDHGNALAESTPVGLPSSTLSVISYGRDEDYFAFDALAGSSYIIRTVLGTLNDSTLTLLDSSGSQVGFSDDYFDLESRIDYTASSSGVLYVIVAGYDGAETGSYDLDITAVESPLPTATAAPAAVVPTPIVVPVATATPSF